MNRLNINWTAKTLVKKMNTGNVNFDNAVQRSLTWDIQRKSLLIHSMLYGYAIPAMYFTRDENGVYDSLDGKQRSNAIMEYMSGEFALHVDTSPVYDDDGNLNNFSGMYYEQLPDWAKDRIKDYNLTIYYYEDMTEAEIREFFRRLNNGKPLTAVELTRVNTPCLEVFQQLAKHDAIQNVVTEAGKRRFTDENIAMQIYHMATVETPDFSTKSFREWAKSVETDDVTIGKIQSGLDAYVVFFESLDPATDKKVLRTIKTRTHFVSCAYYCYLAVQAEATQDEINQTLKAFFSGSPSTSDEYNKTVGSGSAKPTAVQTRQKAMQELANYKPEQQPEQPEQEVEDPNDSSADDQQEDAEQDTIEDTDTNTSTDSDSEVENTDTDLPVDGEQYTIPENDTEN